MENTITKPHQFSFLGRPIPGPFAHFVTAYPYLTSYFNPALNSLNMRAASAGSTAGWLPPSSSACSSPLSPGQAAVAAAAAAAAHQSQLSAASSHSNGSAGSSGTAQCPLCGIQLQGIDVNAHFFEELHKLESLRKTNELDDKSKNGNLSDQSLEIDIENSNDEKSMLNAIQRRNTRLLPRYQTYLRVKQNRESRKLKTFRNNKRFMDEREKSLMMAAAQPLPYPGNVSANPSLHHHSFALNQSNQQLLQMHNNLNQANMAAAAAAAAAAGMLMNNSNNRPGSSTPAQNLSSSATASPGNHSSIGGLTSNGRPASASSTSTSGATHPASTSIASPAVSAAESNSNQPPITSSPHHPNNINALLLGHHHSGLPNLGQMNALAGLGSLNALNSLGSLSGLAAGLGGLNSLQGLNGLGALGGFASLSNLNQAAAAAAICSAASSASAVTPSPTITAISTSMTGSVPSFVATQPSSFSANHSFGSGMCASPLSSASALDARGVRPDSRETNASSAGSPAAASVAPTAATAVGTNIWSIASITGHLEAAAAALQAAPNGSANIQTTNGSSNSSSNGLAFTSAPSPMGSGSASECCSPRAEPNDLKRSLSDDEELEITDDRDSMISDK